MKELLLKALERIEQYKELSGIESWILDTVDLRAELKEIERMENIVSELWEMPKSDHSMQTVSYTFSNSQITAMCIRAGITNLEDIKWVKDSSPAYADTVEEHIQYLLQQKKQL